MVRLCIYIFLFLLPVCAEAQQYRFIHYSASDGLSQNSVHCIYQDSDGLLWIGTQDGLNSFDGHNFKTLRSNHADTNTLSDQFILSMAEDSRGYLWVGTGNGLNRINRRTGKVRRYYLDASEQNRISSNYSLIIRNKAKEVFIQHPLHPLLVDKNGSIKYLDKAFSAISWAGFDSAGNFWGIKVATQQLIKATNLAGAPRMSAVNNAPAEVFQPNKSYKFKIDNNNCIWFYPTNAIGNIYFYKTNENVWQQFSQPISTVINDVLITQSGTGWVAAQDGMYIIKDYLSIEKMVGTPANTSTLPAGSILSVYEDNRQNIWIGSANSGFAYYNPAFENFRLFETGQVNNAVTSVVDAENNKRWIGTTSGLLMFAKNGNSKLTVQKTLFTDKRITGLTKDHHNNIWAAVQNDGLYIINAQGTILKAYKRNDSLLETKRVLHLFCDSKNRVFVCTEVGYFVFTSPTSWLPFYQRSKMPAGTGWYVLHAFEDRQKNIWLSKHRGIEVLDSNLNTINEIQSNTNTSPIHRTIITACAQDDKGNMWIGTLSDGIYMYNGKTMTRFTTNDGLSSNVIYGLLTDDKGRIWATTTSGANVYEQSEKKFYPLTAIDGLPSYDFLLGAFFKNESGELMAGSSKGLVTIAANHFVPKTKKIAARVKDVKIDGESIEVFSNSFVVYPGYNTLSFEFAVKEALQPRNIYYQYRMPGVNTKWVTLDAYNPGITFSNLPYKKLTMEVRAAYSLPDIETAPIEKFEITVEPPFTKTNGFRFIVLLLALACLALLFRFYNIRKSKKHLQALQTQKELQQERNRISRDLHDNIGAYTSALIAGINRLKVNEENKEQQFAELNEYAANIMGYLRETIWVLSHEQLTLTAFADRFNNYAARIAKNYPQLSVSCNTDIKNERLLHPQVSLNLFRILQEALQNACKHADASNIDVHIYSDSVMQLSVADNGKGIADAGRDDSYGIKNMQARAAESGFEIIIDSANRKGTLVILKEKV